ncbi:MAG: hypothetical protein LBR42_04500, partial [Candidatus Methanoplasma sp.]|nr:hypothetical protein [Candidatus Methanoplasma sp.]
MKSGEVSSDDYAGGQGMPIVEHLRQAICVFKLQMRLYSKSISTYIFILFALLIPLFAFSGALEKIIGGWVELNIAYVLILLPLMIVAIPARFSGKIMSSEFRNRTAFINFPLPMSRITFFMGKFLAALTMSLT